MPGQPYADKKKASFFSKLMDKLHGGFKIGKKVADGFIIPLLKNPAVQTFAAGFGVPTGAIAGGLDTGLTVVDGVLGRFNPPPKPKLLNMGNPFYNKPYKSLPPPTIAPPQMATNKTTEFQQKLRTILDRPRVQEITDGTEDDDEPDDIDEGPDLEEVD
jgi:hypothetical protein